MNLVPEQSARILQSIHDNIIDKDEPKGFIESLDNMFETFMYTEGIADGVKMRSNIYGHYKGLRQFLMELE